MFHCAIRNFFLIRREIVHSSQKVETENSCRRRLMCRGRENSRKNNCTGCIIYASIQIPSIFYVFVLNHNANYVEKHSLRFAVTDNKRYLMKRAKEQEIIHMQRAENPLITIILCEKEKRAQGSEGNKISIFRHP